MESVPKPDIQRQENSGECFKWINPVNYQIHYYLVRDNDVLHITNNLINALYDNIISYYKSAYNHEFISINRYEFNEQLNNVIFNLNFIGNEFCNK